MSLIFPLHVYIFPRTLGLILLGALAWRTSLSRNDYAGRGLLLFATIGIVFGMILIAIAKGHVSTRPLQTMTDAVGTIVLAMSYGGFVVGATRLSFGRAFFNWAVPLGRMAFTNYLMQSIIFGWIFYGYGLGLFGSLSVSVALAVGLTVYTGQAIFSAWWLKRYIYGPVEWLWRSLMYGKMQPISRGF